MNTINLHNYEAFYLDYIEGNLGTEDTAALVLFFENNPSLKEELDSFELLTLDGSLPSSPDFSYLKQQISSTNAEEYIIARLEGRLNEEDEKELNALLNQNSDLEKLAVRYSKTILPKRVMQFPAKEKLKKKPGILIVMTPIRRVAAVAVLLLTLVPFYNRKSVVEVAQMQQPPSVALADTDSAGFSNSETEMTTKNISNAEVNSAEQKTLVASQSITENDKTYPNTPAPRKQTPFRSNAMVLDKIEQKTIHALDYYPNKERLVQLKRAMETTKPVEPLLAQTSPPETLGGWLNKTIRKRLFNEDEPTPKKLDKNDFLAGASSVLQERTNTNVAYNQAVANNKTSYSVTIGKFSFYKTKSNY